MSAIIKFSLIKRYRRRVGVYVLLAVFFPALAAQCLGQQADTVQYEYDRLDRVTKVTYVSSGASITYTYDAAGNRTASTVAGSNLAPVLTSLGTESVTAGTRGFTLGINGNNLYNGATVRWNGNSRPATYFGPYVTIQLTDADLAASGTISVSVVNPAPGGSESNSLTFTVRQPNCTLRIDSVTPVAGRTSGAQQVRLVGSFANLSAVRVGGVSAPVVATNGTSEVTVTTPAHGAGAVSIELVPTSGDTCARANAFAYLPSTFTDNTLVAGVTTVKAQHIIELRQAVDSLRAVAGLGPAPWGAPSLTPTVNVITTAQVTELRAFLEDVAARLGYPAQTYSEPALGPGFQIKRIHIEELRQRIRSIAG